MRRSAPGWQRRARKRTELDYDKHVEEGPLTPRGHVPLAPLIEEHIRLAGEMSGQSPGFWEDVTATWFELTRWRRQRARRRAEWLKARREGG